MTYCAARYVQARNDVMTWEVAASSAVRCGATFNWLQLLRRTVRELRGQLQSHTTSLPLPVPLTAAVATPLAQVADLPMSSKPGVRDLFGAESDERRGCRSPH